VTAVIKGITKPVKSVRITVKADADKDWVVFQDLKVKR